MNRRIFRLFALMLIMAAVPAAWASAGASAAEAAAPFPRPLESYQQPPAGQGVWAEVKARAAAEPFNVVATVIFLLAVLHTFATGRIRRWAHAVDSRFVARQPPRVKSLDRNGDELPDKVSFGGQMLHFLGEVEVVFGIWAVVLGLAIVWCKGMGTALDYIGEKVNYTEPAFVVIIMALAATRPVVRLSEQCLRWVANLLGGQPVAWWLSILTIAPLLGSFITEPAAMTIAALLLVDQFFVLQPSRRLKYATIGLLFVNVSVGGTLTHFAAPPVLMVAGKWGWGMGYMFTHFGWHAVSGIVISNGLYFLMFSRELLRLKAPSRRRQTEEPVPAWVTAVHVLFLAFTVWMAHYMVLFIGGFLFFLAFAQATGRHQSRLELRGPLLVGFFLAGLVIHGGLQAWWIQPVLGSLGEKSLFAGATILTAFNDNALITYLASLVPGFTEQLKFAVLSGAVTGGGLTVIANAPNPAGQSILQRYFDGGVSPLWLFVGALLPTLVVAFSFMVL